MHRLKSHIQRTRRAINQVTQTFSVCLGTKRMRRTALIHGRTMLESGSGMSREQEGDQEIGGRSLPRGSNGFVVA